MRLCVGVGTSDTAQKYIFQAAIRGNRLVGSLAVRGYGVRVAWVRESSRCGRGVDKGHPREWFSEGGAGQRNPSRDVGCRWGYDGSYSGAETL